MRRIRFAVRALARTPIVTLVVVLSLGLGIGANTSIFSILYQIVLRSLPVQDPEHLVLLTSPGNLKNGRSSTDNSGDMDSVFNYRMFRALEKQPQALSGVAGFRNFGANVAYGTQTISGSTMVVSGNYFPLLGVQPLIGRLIGPGDDHDGAGNPVAVLGYGYWNDRLGGPTTVLNQPVRVNGQVFTIVGVAPRGFNGLTLGQQPEVYVPIAFKPEMTPGWDGTDKVDDYWVYLFGRLKPSVRKEQAESALNTVYSGVVEEQAKLMGRRDPDYLKRFLKGRITLRDGRQGQSAVRDEGRIQVFILMGATVLVLLIAMANAANLMLARSAQRRKELAIRAALGAGRRDIMGQLLTEALLLAAAGGIAGLLCAYWTLRLLATQLQSGDAPSYVFETGLQWPVLLFCLGVSLLAGLLFGLYPAWEAARTSVSTNLKDASTQTTATTGSARMRKVLVCGQVAVSALLLIPTGLFLKSLVNLLHVDLGIRTENLITFGISPDLNGYSPDRARALFERVEQEIAATPGVNGVTAAKVPLIGGDNWGNDLAVEGYSRDPNADTNSLFNLVGPGFFGRMGVPLIAGREFTDRDNLGAPKVAVVNEQWAKHFFGNQNPVGRHFGTDGPGSKALDVEVVGVVKDTNYSSVKQKPPRLYYLAYRQSKDIGNMSFYVRTALPPAQMFAELRRLLTSLDRDLPVKNLRTLDDQVQLNVRSDRLVFQLAGTFAVLATTLAMLGLYGVMAYSVTRRTREIGIRLALGADTSGIRMMIMREVMFIFGTGLVIGVPLSLAVARLAESQLFGVKAFDTAVILGAILALLLAAVAAGYIPTRRATRVNPVQALRYE
jgi:predicted permease